MPNNQNSLASLKDVRTYMKIGSSDATQDTFFYTLIGIASQMIENYCRRTFRLQTYTEYHDGKGSVKYGDRFFTRQFPIDSVTTLYDSFDRGYATADIVDSDDYAIDLRTGEIVLDGTAPYFSRGKSTIKVIYIAGYEGFEIITGMNDALDFVEGAGSELNATLDAGIYNGDDLATEIKTQLEDAGALTYSITHRNDGKFSIIPESSTIAIPWADGTNNTTSCGTTIGFDVSANDAAASSLVGDYEVYGLPDDIQMACAMIVFDIYNQGKQGTARQGRETATTAGGIGGETFITDEAIPSRAQFILDKYRKAMM